MLTSKLVTASLMKLKTKSQPLVGNQFLLSRIPQAREKIYFKTIWVSLFGLTTLLDGQEVLPLIEPKILNESVEGGGKLPEIELGFPGGPVVPDVEGEGVVPVLPPSSEGGIVPLEGDPNSLPTLGEIIDPVPLSDPIAAAGGVPIESEEIPEEPDTDSVSDGNLFNDGDAGVLGGAIWMPETMGLSPGVGSFWPSGFADDFGGDGFGGGGFFDQVRDGLGLSLNLRGSYDSNP